MKFKNNFKRFFTLDRHHDAGFTLVELIVVIAILAILAGVAVPAYSGYIKKAEKANDLQLLGACNQAFAAAAMENDKDLTKLVGTEIALDANGKITGMTVKEATVSGEAAEDPMFTSFKKYYGDNIATPFKYFVTKLVYGLDGFIGQEPGEDTITVTVGGVAINVSKENAEALRGSTFATAEGLGAEGLLGRVQYVTDFAATLIGTEDSEAFAQVMGGEAYMQSLAAYLGIENASSITDLEALDDAITARMDELGLEDTDAVLANGAVLFAAQNASSVNKDDIITLLGTAGTKGNIVDSLDESDGKAMAEAALAYGMYTAYAYQSGNQDLVDKVENGEPVDIMNELDDQDFMDYINSDQGKADLDGYLAALTMISDGAASPDAATEVLGNGFNNEEMQKLLNSVLGSK